MIFVNSMSDLFHEEIPDDFIAKVFQVMFEAHWHIFQVLTKRPERMRDLMLRWHQHPDVEPQMLPLPNVWLGVSIENRKFVGRADVLRETPAAVRFISAEPLLGPLLEDSEEGSGAHYATAGLETHEIVGSTEIMMPAWADGYEGSGLSLEKIDWLIVGGESGPGHRPMAMEWVENLRDACWNETEFCFGKRVRGPAFFFKQDSGTRAGQLGRFTNKVSWAKEMPAVMS